MPGADDPELVVTRADGVTTLRLNRPQRLNALDARQFGSLQQTLLDAEQDPATRAVVLTGTGRAFCSGGDVKSAQASRAGARPSDVLALVHDAQNLFTLMEWMSTPIVTMVNGLAMGGGLALVLSSDLAVACDTAVFGAPEARRGFVDPYLPSRLAARIGLERAKYLTLAGRSIDAETARNWGLVSLVATADDLAAVTAELVGDLVASSAEAIGSFKQMMRRTLPAFDLGAYYSAITSADAIAGAAEFSAPES